MRIGTPWTKGKSNLLRREHCHLCVSFKTISFSFSFFLKKKLINLTAWGLSCRMWDIHCIIWDLSLRCTGSSVHGLSSCCVRAQLFYGMWDLSSLTKDRTCMPCIARWILKHWIIKEASPPMFFREETALWPPALFTCAVKQ